MANSLSGRVWTVDTAAVITLSPTKMKSIRWVSVGGTVGDQARIVDPVTGGALWFGVANDVNFAADTLVESWWSRGFTVGLLQSGTLFLEVC